MLDYEFTQQFSIYSLQKTHDLIFIGMYYKLEYLLKSEFEPL